MDSYNSPTTKPIFQASQLIWYILTLFESILLLRFFLKLLEANPTAGFTSLIYGLSAPLVAPFQAVFKTVSVSGSIFEWTTLLAMFIYWLIAVAVIRLLFMGKTVSTREAAQKIEANEV
jgi:uncharacterized protein YggT (Ycf19 family)